MIVGRMAATAAAQQCGPSGRRGARASVCEGAGWGVLMHPTDPERRGAKGVGRLARQANTARREMIHVTEQRQQKLTFQSGDVVLGREAVNFLLRGQVCTIFFV